MDVKVLSQTAGVSSLRARREDNIAKKSWLGVEMSDVFHPQIHGFLGDTAVEILS